MCNNRENQRTYKKKTVLKLKIPVPLKLPHIIIYVYYYMRQFLNVCSVNQIEIIFF